MILNNKININKSDYLGFDIDSSDGVVRLSISPSQGDDPGFKSRSEQLISDLNLTIDILTTLQ